MINIIDEKDLAWLGSLLCFSFILVSIFKAGKVAPGKEILLAYILTSLINHIFFTTYGLSALFDGTMSELSTDSTSRTSPANLENFVKLAHKTYAYDVFNTMAAIVIPEYRTAEFLGHHILTAIIAKFSQTEGPDFYGFFFFGIASVSTLVLVFVDIFRHGPAYLRDTFPAVNTFVQILFAVLFLVVRAAIWPLVSLVFWYDTVHIIRYPPESRSPYRPYLFILLIANTFLSCLQMMWAKRIFSRAMKLFTKSPNSSKVKDSSKIHQDLKIQDDDNKNSEQSPLLHHFSNEQNNAPMSSATANDNNDKRNNFEGTIKGILKGMESFLDWAPFITVQSLCGSQSPEYALGAGTVAAVVVLLYSLFKQYLRNSIHNRQLAFVFQPRILDFGQFILFGILYVIAKLLQSRQDDSIGVYILLWFNPFTTGGMAVIMYSSIQCGRPFVYDYVLSEMSPNVWNRMISKKWFQDILTQAAMFWVKILTAMTVVVTIQPLLVTFFYRGDVTKDTSGFMVKLGNWLTCGQFIILFYGFYDTYRMHHKGARIKKRVSDMKQNGLTVKEQELYGDLVDVKMLGSSHRIVSLVRNEHLKEGAIVLSAAFQMDELLQGYLNTEEAMFSFFYANLKSMSYFHHVLACLDDDIDPLIKICKPKCIMACIPVLSKTQEELEVFNSHEAWVEHGFTVPGATETNFQLPDDDLIEMGQMKSRRVHCLHQQPYIYIAFFGAGLIHKRKGYGKTLLNYIIGVSERKRLPLVLETSTVWNRTQYEKYGFKVIDHVKEQPNLVLMLRSVGQSDVSNV